MLQIIRTTLYCAGGMIIQSRKEVNPASIMKWGMATACYNCREITEEFGWQKHSERGQ